MLIDCGCGTTNRIPGLSAKRHRCGKCQHVFTPAELVKARQEPAPPTMGDLLSSMMGGDMPRPSVNATHACKDEDDCGWEGTEEKRCPDCGKRVVKLED
jgi:rubredoxin